MFSVSKPTWADLLVSNNKTLLSWLIVVWLIAQDALWVQPYIILKAQTCVLKAQCGGGGENNKEKEKGVGGLLNEGMGRN